MIERDEKKQIAASVAVVVFISAALLVMSFIGFMTFKKAQTNEAKQYLYEVTEQYKNTVEKQIDGDMQMLKALSTFIGEGGEFQKEKILEYLKLENSRNHFTKMGYIDLDGIGYFVGLNAEEYYNEDVSSEQFVKEALSGKANVSDTIKDRFTDEYVNCYGVPIYMGGQIIGALSAISSADTFNTIIDRPIFNGKGYLHLIKSNGDFVVRGKKFIVQDELRNIFEKGHMGAEKEKEVLQNIGGGKDYFTDLQYQGAKYWMNFKAVNFNDWYIYCIVPQDSLSQNFVKVINIAGIVLGIVILMFAVLFLYIYRIMKRNRQAILQLAYFDQLTGAYNKEKFWDDATKRLCRDGRYAFVVLNVGNFRFFNELFGFEEGDSLLIHVAGVLRESLQPEELFYRETADNFGMLMRLDDKRRLEKRLRDIMDRISQYPLRENRNYSIVCSCGVKVIESFSKKMDLDLFMDMAAMALKSVKGNHMSSLAFYDEKLHREALERSTIENQMREALENGEFLVNLQPKIDLRTGRAKSAEALVRWKRKDGTMVYPDTFIPIFEQNGFITKLDMHMLEQVCAKLREWMDAGLQAVPIAVNQSRKLFYQSSYLSDLRKTLENYRIDPSMIILEVTESVVAENTGEITQLLQKLHDMGFTISMDDFGSGYSSLNILSEFPIDELKLDKVFLEARKNRIRKESVMKNVVRLAKELHIATVVEGVETEEQVEFVKEIGCDIAQGYYFAKPMTMERFEKQFLE